MTELYDSNEFPALRDMLVGLGNGVSRQSCFEGRAASRSAKLAFYWCFMVRPDRLERPTFWFVASTLSLTP